MIPWIVIIVSCLTAGTSLSLILPTASSLYVPSSRLTLRNTQIFLRDDDTSFVAASKKTRNVCVLESPDWHSQSLELARQLSLPTVTDLDLKDRRRKSLDFSMDVSHILSLQPYSLGNVNDYALGISHVDNLRDALKTSKSASSGMKPYYIDFCPPPTSKLGKRRSGESGPDLLLKAVCRPAKREPSLSHDGAGRVVYDLTAGLGQDAFLIATAGKATTRRVHMVEQNPIIAALLEDAMRRLQFIANRTNDESTSRLTNSLLQCLSVECGDGVQVVNRLLDSKRNDSSTASLIPDIVYLDPMFPIRRKRALVKKNMQILHTLLDSQQKEVSTGDDEQRLMQEQKLLEAAWNVAKDRVVVKRPINAPTLGYLHETVTPLRPSYQLTGSINRWDIYLK